MNPRGQLTFGAFDANARHTRESLGPGAVVLRGFVTACANDLLDEVARIAKTAAFRHMVTRGGLRMSAAMTNCGALGWTSDARGYRYADVDPDTHERWPAMPAIFHRVARDAATDAGFADFVPDACLINRYEPGARLSLHQDKDERDFTAPIVSVSLGIDAVFLFGGDARRDPAARVRLVHGDVVVWGGPARLRFHGVLPLAPDVHPLTGAARINLTFRKAG